MVDGRGSVGEPMFKAPWPVTVLVGVIVGAWLLQLFVIPEPWEAQLALSRDGLMLGFWFEPITHLFLHGGITHLILNAIAAFAFGPPIVRLLGMRNGDIALFYIFFLVCGALAGLGWLAIPLQGPGILLGASGAISGLWGVASRLLGRRGDLAPLLDRNVLTQAAGFILVNVVIGLLGPSLLGVAIGWQAHIVGYAAGLLLIGLFGRLAGRIR